MLKKTSTLAFLVVYVLMSTLHAVTIGLHGIQSYGSEKLIQREQEKKSQIPLIGVIFDEYGTQESDYLQRIVSELGTGRVYHISLSPFGYTAAEVAEGRYDKEYKKFFKDIQSLQIKVVFRTMHEMNGGRYSRASHPEDFKKARKHVWKLARNDYKLQANQLLFSLSFNSQDLPTTDSRPNQKSSLRFCNEWESTHRGRCARKIDYYPGNKYVDLIGVTLYNRGRSRSDTRAKRMTPTQLLNQDGLIDTLSQRNKPIIIDELGTTAINFDGERSHNKAKEVFDYNNSYKNQWLQERDKVIQDYPLIKAMVYFNMDHSQGMSEQVIGEAERSIILSDHHKDYKEGVKLLTKRNNSKDLYKLFKTKKT